MFTSDEKIRNTRHEAVADRPQQAGAQVVGEHDEQENRENRNIAVGFLKNLRRCFQQAQQRMHEDRRQNGNYQCHGNADDDTGCDRFFHPVRLLPSKAARRDDRKTVSDAERKSGHHLIDG